jgi:hypothetical protein
MFYKVGEFILVQHLIKYDSLFALKESERKSP